MKISKKIGITLTILLVIGLGAVFGFTLINMEDVMKNTTIARFKESAMTRSQYLQSYMKDAEMYLEAFSKSDEVSEVLINTNDSTRKAAQAYTERYASTNKNLENLYIADVQSVQHTGVVTTMLGKPLREGDSLKELTSKVFAGDEVVNVGVLISPSTGALVFSMYCPVYDASSNPLGFVGMAMCADELLSILDSIDTIGIDNCSYALLDAKKGVYISCANSEENGKEITDENYLSMIKSVGNDRKEHIFMKDYKDSSNHKKVAVYNYIPDRDWIFVIEVDNSSLYDSINRLVLTLIVVCIVVLALCVTCIFIITNQLLRGVGRVATAIDEVAKLNISGNKSLDQYLGRKDEVGIIANATHSLKSELRKIISNLKGSSQLLSDDSEELNQLFQQSKESVEQVELAVSEIASGAGNQSEETQKASNSVVQIGDMIERLNEEAISVHNNANEMNDISSKVVSTLSELKNINEKTEASVDEVHRQTDLTNESILKIQSAVAIISSIADETSLLSLNASIEAARAGEEGRGFAVVATQIKKLAEQSNESAKEINDTITMVMRDSQTTVEIMKEVSENVRQQSQQMEETMEAFRQLTVEIKESIEGINNISDQTKEIDQSRIEVVDVVTNLSAIAQQNAASTEETLASVSIVNETMLELAKMANELAEMAESIDVGIREFIL